MKIPVFARRSNPAIDPPIIRKSFAYCARQVADGLADWIGVGEPERGIIARELLPRESLPVFAPEPSNPALPPVEVSGVIFEDPEQSEAKKLERANLVLQARAISHFGADKTLVPV